jgi:murein DD-endopeptidase MepM/ murein hydrolase activator NlpD
MVYRSKNIILALILIIISAMSTISYAGDKISIDNWDVHQYRGNPGLWKLIESKNHLRAALKKYGTSYKDFYSLNGRNFKYNSYLFIPYSMSYLKELKKKNLKRKIVNVSRDQFIWPIAEVDRISSPFGMRWGVFHNGVDLPKRRGTPVIAAMDGIVIESAYSGGYGNTISIQCRNNIFTRYSHNSVLLVKKGDLVKKGQVIAFVGSTGNSTGNHLHFEIRYKNIPLNPLDFLPKKENITYGLNPDLKKN